MFSKIFIPFVAVIFSRLIVIAAGNPVSGSTVTYTNVSSRAPATFKHPGVLIDREQLDFIKGKVQSGAQPWTDAYNAMLSDPLASLSRTPSPTTTVQCGPTSTPNIGCTDEREDALAAYAMSLAWYISGSAKYAQKAISYMNAWASTIKGHELSNAPLQTGWAGAGWTRAAEIIRWTNAGWASADVTAFENMLRNVYLPTVIKGSQNNGNWELVMLEAALGISVFLEDKNSYDTAMNKFLGRVPAYVYLLKDGDTPKTAPGSGLDTRAKIVNYWQGQSTFQANGIAQETCRDFVHTGYGLSSISHIAETSRIQGTDLYSGDVGERLQYGLGFHAQFEMGAAAKPSWLCVNKNLKLGLGPITEVGFNALHTRLGIAMTNTQALTEKQRLSLAGTNHLFVGWETLTHAGNMA
ncbi:chondroitin AC/alginate lyase [Dendrothele bispora CBS 962.96]|uniref:Chondroitin AC/alginate lyase n=1 Tax=Dendrothele bispora (strain CBS 962.96) TaxID=1314807 RepID=A0A4S8M8Z6_DENBC|nr:chondroitin AC/alginate lyase [Dendrothele bispora CBS 962.96]